jgi:hypothetical protein
MSFLLTARKALKEPAFDKRQGKILVKLANDQLGKPTVGVTLPSQMLVLFL